MQGTRTGSPVRSMWTGRTGKAARSPRSSSQDKTNRLRKHIDESLHTLARAVDGVRASDTFKAYLDVQARFHRYSWCNSLLILSQRANATQVAGYRTWQSLGRQVRKGEHGITIFAPRPFKRERDDGETEAGIYFRAVHVFDVSQTDGPDLPSVDMPDVAESADALLSDLQRVAVSREIAVTFSVLSDGMYGVSKGGSIEIDVSRPTGQQAKTLAHELAHEAMHKTREQREDMPERSRPVAELEAESVAYVVCRHFGLDAEVRASRYIALWDGDSKALKASLGRIADTARKLIDDVATIRGRKAAA